jgi:hypothetical protein
VSRSPLPAIGDPDPRAREWASLRVKELAQWAKRVERDDPLRARQMWRPAALPRASNGEALAGVMRARAVTVHRPDLVDDAQSARVKDPWIALDAPLALAVDHAREERVEGELRSLRGAVVRSRSACAPRSSSRRSRRRPGCASGSRTRPQAARARA